jgi:hypothetical protein
LGRDEKEQPQHQEAEKKSSDQSDNGLQVLHVRTSPLIGRRLTAGRSAAGPAARDGSQRPSSSAKHYHGSIGTRYGPVSCSALLGGPLPTGLEPRTRVLTRGTTTSLGSAQPTQ